MHAAATSVVHPSPLRSPTGESVPLRDVSLRGDVVGGYAHLVSIQRYRHDGAKPIEAIYTFPLPSEAAVTGFVMEVGGRRFEAEAKEREAAFRAYDDALVDGHGAALVEQERANVFTANVGNVLGGEDVRIEIAFVMKASVDEGVLRLSIPTLVAPRYVPGHAEGARTGHGTADPTRRVPDADRISPPVGSATYTLAVELTLHFGPDAAVSSPSHELRARHDGAAWRVSIAEAALDRDLVIVVEPDEEASLERIVAHRDPSGGDGYAVVSFIPDLSELAPRDTAPATFTFLLDRSGSMGGTSIVEARRALRLCLRQLRAGDRFAIIAFDNRCESFASGLSSFDERTLAAADAWIESIDARGGTELLEPLERAVTYDGVVILLTDGQVGNEREILSRTLEARGARAVRVHTFGIGSAVSDALLSELARETSGSMELIHPGERIDEKVVATFSSARAVRVSAPTLSVEGAELDAITPRRVPDLVDGEPWSITARYVSPGPLWITLRGQLGGAPYEHTFTAELPERADAPFVRSVWARERVRDLEAMEVSGRHADAMRARIVELALEHGLASRYTSLLVVERRTGDRRTSEAAQLRVIPVAAPAGWDLQRASGGAVNRTSTARGLHRQAMAAPPTFAPRMPAAPAPAAAPTRERAAVVPERRPAPIEIASAPIEQVFEAQRASGLWDAPGAGLTDTLVVLQRLLRAELTSAHRVFGGQIKKVIEATVAEALEETIPSEDRERALLLGSLLASGPKTRRRVEDALRALSPEAAARLADEDALRAELLR